MLVVLFGGAVDGLDVDVIQLTCACLAVLLLVAAGWADERCWWYCG